MMMIFLILNLGTFLIFKAKPKEIVTNIIPSCLVERAEEYCLDNDYLGVTSVSENYFYCVIAEYPRSKTTDTTAKIYFLDEEINHCEVVRI